MAEKIYKSQLPACPLVDASIWSLLFANDSFPSATNEPAFVDSEAGYTVTRGQLRSLTLSLAWGLRTHLLKLGGPRLTRGSTIMIFSPNTIAWPMMLFGSIAAGFKCTLANSSYTPPELAHQWKDSQADLIFVHPALLQVTLDMFTLVKISPEDFKTRIVLATHGLTAGVPSGFFTMEDFIGKGSLSQEEKFDGPDANETALLCYSSGTTGQPKGVESSHKNITSSLQMTSSTYPFLVHGKDLTIGLLPFYHIYGAAQILLFPYLLAVPVVVMAKYEPDHFCKTIEKYCATYINVVPPILLALAHHPSTNKYNLKSLKMLYSGAAPLGAPLATSVREKFKSVGVDVVVGQGYGLTETSPISHVLLPQDTERKVGSVGILLPNMEARLVNELDESPSSTDADEGEPGELWLRGPNIMKGYLNNKMATKNSITSEGWFKTGDVAIRDKEGFFYIVDRKKELIKYNGFQVPPAELESVLLQHPEVRDAAVIGVQSTTEATELPRAYVVSSKPFKTDQEKAAFCNHVQGWIQTRVAKHKFLRGGVVVLDIIPKSAAGKIQRKDLRERAKKELVHGLLKGKL